MARLGRKPVRPGRATIAVALGTLGLFVISMAAGLGSAAGGWPIGAVGAAMVIVAVALLTTASMRGGDKSFVAGTVQVVKVSDPPLHDTEFGRCEMQVLVDSPGHPGQTVMIRDPRVPVAKWPEVGDILPALVNVSDARRVKIQWERVGVYGEEYDEEYEYSDDGGGQQSSSRPVYSDEEQSGDDYPTSEFPPVTEPLPRRKPSPTPHAAAGPGSGQSVAVLEGELIPVDLPGPRSPLAAEEPSVTVEALDFRDMPEPARPTASGTGPVFQEDHGSPVLPTQPAARPASAGSIHGVGITVIVSDLRRSQAFYQEMLGFYEIDGGDESVVLASHDTRLVLMTARSSAPIHLRQVHLNLEVGDVEAIYRELKVRGVKFTSPPRVVNRGKQLELVAASFKDPDGHGIAIIQWKARTA